MEIEIQTSKVTQATPKKFLQLGIASFMNSSQLQPIIPLEIANSSKPLQRLKKTQKSSAIEHIEEVKLEEEPDGVEEQKQDEVSTSRRSMYQKTSYEKKLQVLEDFIKFKSNPPMDASDKTMSLNSFFRTIESTVGIRTSTAKTLCFSYEKDNSILIKLQLHCSGGKRGKETGNIKQRISRLSYPLEVENEIFDYIQWGLDLGVPFSRADIKAKAMQLITPHNPNFKASDSWLDRFFDRNHLSLRCNNSSSQDQQAEYAEIAAKFSLAMRKIISQHKIKAENIINLDETPFFWDYLPKKIVCSKFSQQAASYKRGYHHRRSTVTLAVTANGEILRPCLVLKRKTPYFLQTENDINLLLLQTESGWMEENSIITWIDRILIPHIKDKPSLLLMDSYRAHISPKVLNHLKTFPNLHVGIIVGGTTSYSQPLDIMVNKEFKRVCRQKSLEYTRRLVLNLNEINAQAERDVNDKIISINNQVVMADKDLTRKKKAPKKLTQAVLLKTMTIEDIYGWIKEAFLSVKNKPRLMIKGFVKAGYIDDSMSGLQEGSESEIQMERSQNEVFENLIPLSENEESETEDEVNEERGLENKEMEIEA